MNVVRRGSPGLSGNSGGARHFHVGKRFGQAERNDRSGHAHAPGTPAKYNKFKVVKQGPAKAKKILLLEPGTSAGATNFRPAGNALPVGQLKGWQVWSIERRENLLEDHSMLEKYLKGDATNEEMLDYYLGWILDGSVQPHFEGKTTAETQYARRSGLSIVVHDLRKVVNMAPLKGGHKVVLGGHSLGGSIVTAYATWNFNGTPGAIGTFRPGLHRRCRGPRGRGPAHGREAQANLDSLNAESASPFITLVPPPPWRQGSSTRWVRPRRFRDPTRSR